MRRFDDCNIYTFQEEAYTSSTAMRNATRNLFHVRDSSKLRVFECVVEISRIRRLP